jgi:hypothetical protein
MERGLLFIFVYAILFFVFLRKSTTDFCGMCTNYASREAAMADQTVENAEAAAEPAEEVQEPKKPQLSDKCVDCGLPHPTHLLVKTAHGPMCHGCYSSSV